jgi:hypothetical protein
MFYRVAFAAVCLICLSARPVAAGTWTALANQAPDYINTMLLLPNGTVMAANGENAWYLLTPDIHGSYINGTWTTLAAMNDTRLYYASDVLTNGEVFIAGGEYGTGTASGEIYNPLLNSWTMCAGSGSSFLDMISVVLTNGNVLAAPVEPALYGDTAVYDPSTDSWPLFPPLVRGYDQDEASWVLLPDNSVLTIDPYGKHTERYIQSLNQWKTDATVPVTLYDPYGGELGPAFLLPNGNVIFIGSAPYYGIYTPTGTQSPGAWATSSLPNDLGAPDAPSAMMVTGNILCALSPTPTSDNNIFTTPTYFYEYDYSSGSLGTFTLVNAPGGGTSIDNVTFVDRMLDLPDGTVLFADSDPQLYDYQPAGAPLAAGQPTITSITTNFYNSYLLTGTLLNGISQGAAYGDDAQMNSNYPLIRMTNNSTGYVYYARTFNWSSTSVMTGSTPVTTEFTVPSNLPAGAYSLVVVANGISSAPVSFTFTPDTLQISPFTGFAAIGPNGGPVAAQSVNYALIDTGASSVHWSAGNVPAWLTVSTSSGTLNSGGGPSTVAISLDTATAATEPVGTYAATVWFTNLTSGAIQSIPFSYQSTPLVVNGGFEDGSTAYWDLSGSTGISSATNEIQVYSGFYSAALGGNTSYGYLSQTIPTFAGQSYTLSFWLDNVANGGSDDFTATWNGTTLLNETGLSDFGFTQYQYNVTATSSSTVLQFGFINSLGAFGLDDVTLQAALATPVVITQPTNQVVDQGGSATFSVAATGTAPLNYFWRRDGVNIPGATSSNYTISNVPFSDSGSEFSCLVSNAYGVTNSLGATLTVIPPSLVLNGGFETGTFADWALTGETAYNSVVSTAPDVHSGKYGAQLGASDGLGYLSQTLPTIAGQAYEISLWLYCDGYTVNEFVVSWNGNTLFDQTNMSFTPWTNLQFQVTATTTNTVLELGFRDDNGYLGLDDISVYQIASPQFQTITWSGGVVSFSWSTNSGSLYQVQYATNLSSANWVNFTGSVADTGGVLTVTDSPTNSQRFYRVLLLP